MVGEPSYSRFERGWVVDVLRCPSVSRFERGRVWWVKAGGGGWWWVQICGWWCVFRAREDVVGKTAGGGGQQ